MPANTPTEAQMISPEEQQENARKIVAHMSGRHGGDGNTKYDDLFAPDVRIFIDSREDYPIGEITAVGIDALRKNTADLADLAYTYEIEVHSVYTCGPVVILCRTDIRKEEGKPDKPVPAVGVFALKNGKVVEWSDYYR